jgi:hypothetical protein
MHFRNIRLIVRKQLKKQYPNWSRLGCKKKKEIVRKVLDEVVADYDFSGDVEIKREELLSIERQVPARGIISLEEMGQLVDKVNKSRLKKIDAYRRSSKYIKDEELLFIDKLLDDRIINRLLSYDGYSPAMRDIFPCNLFRTELLKAIKYPEVSYRKFCTEEYFGQEKKQNRVFTGLPLNKKGKMIDHTQLSKFRNALSSVQRINLLVYILYHFNKSGIIGNNILHGVDSTELASDCKLPLVTLNIRGKKIRIYNDIDCDGGKRRNKPGKSPYVIGYRLHSLAVIDAKTGHSFPLVSLLAPANLHDSHFFPFLVNLAQAMGKDVWLITADEAYHDKDGSLHEDLVRS